MDDKTNPSIAQTPSTTTTSDPNTTSSPVTDSLGQSQSNSPFPTNEPITPPSSDILAPSNPNLPFTSPPSASMSPDLNASNLNTPPTTLNQGSTDLDSTTQTPLSTPLPTFSPQPPTDTSTQTPVVGSIDTSQALPSSSDNTEPAPTDLSQLTANNSQPSGEIYTPPVSAPETLVVPSSQIPASPSIGTISATTSGGRHTLPLIAVIGALIVILGVAGASAYFILGIGKPANQQPSTSLPIVQQTPLTKPPTQAPSPAVAVPPSTATSSGDQSSFGSLNGGTGVSPSPQASKGPTSAADLLKAKQSSSPSASPKL